MAFIFIFVYIHLQIRMSRTNVIFVVLLISINLAVGQVVTNSAGTTTYTSAIGAMVDHFIALPVYKTGIGNNPTQSLSITFQGTPFSPGEAVHAASSIINMNPNTGGTSNYLHLEVSSLTVNAARTGATLNIKFSNVDDGATFTKFTNIGFHTIFIGEKFNQYAIGSTTLHSGLARNTDMLPVTDNAGINVAQFNFVSSQGTSPFNFAPDATTSTYCGVQKMAESDYRIHVGGCAKTIFMSFVTGFRQQKGVGAIKITASSLIVKDTTITNPNAGDTNFVPPVVTTSGTAGYIYPDGLTIIYERNGVNVLSHIQLSLVFIGMRKFDSTNPDQVVANPDNFIAAAGAFAYDILGATLNTTPQSLFDGLLAGVTLNTKSYTVPDGNMGSVFCGLQTGFEIDATDIQVKENTNVVQLTDTAKVGTAKSGAGCVLVADAPGLTCTSTYSGLVSPTNIAPVAVGVPTPATVSPVSYTAVQYQTPNDIQAYTYTISDYNAAGVTSTSTTLSRSFTLPAGTRQVVLYVQLKTFTDTTLGTAQTPPAGKLQYKITIPQVPLSQPVRTLSLNSKTQKIVFTVPAGTTTITPTIQFLTGDITTADPITMATTVAFTPVVYTNLADGSNCGVACPDRTGFTIGLDLTTNPPTCLYCSIAGYWVFDSAMGKCRCADNYFQDTTVVPSVCTRCTDPLCLTCTAASTCTACVANAANNGAGTPCACNPGFYPGAGGVCVACPIGCSTCTSATSCQSCVSTPGSNRLPAAQGCACAPRFYEVPGQIACQACAPYCLTCSGSATNCLTCDSTANLVPSNPVGSCVCATGYYYLDPAVRQCVACSPICQTCSGSSIYCLTCKPGSNRTLSFIDSTSTYRTCKCDTANGYVQLNSQCVDSKCRDLDPYCQNCAVDTFTLVKRCIDCVGDRIYNGTACVCNSGFYTAADGSCVACGLGCQICNSTACQICANRATPNADGVTCTCPSNTFLLTTNSGVYCSPCSSNCLTCANSSTSCATCRPGFTINGTNACVCTGSTYLSSDGQSCLSCMLNCQTCQNSTACDLCSPQYAYDSTNHICTLNCLAGTYSNGVACVACAAGCGVCTSSWLCQSCTTGYNLYAGACFEDCPFGSYANGGFCLGCPSQCADCDSASVCTACNDPYVLLVNSCLNDCPNGTFFAAGSCRACNQTCATCRGFSTYCLSCPSPRILYNNTCYTTCPVATVNNTCTDVCPAGTFLNGSICQQCLAPCQTCVGTASNCTSCATGYSQNGQCVDNCPAGTFGSGGFCAACDVSCQTCQVNAFQCIQCAAGFTRAGFNCIRSCQSGFFFNTTTQSCQSCGPGCRICTSATLCTTCMNPSVIPTNGMCQQPCPTGAQVVGGICVCNMGVLHQNICITACPAGFFASTNRVCIACTAPCANCTTSSTNCLSCQLGYTFNSTTRTCTQSSTCGYGQYRSDAGICTNICSTGFYFNTGCIFQCPPGYQNNTSGGCIQTLNPTFCTFPLIQHGSSCVASCPVGFYLDYNTRSCVRCLGNCVSCLSATYCIACANGYILNADQSACILSNSCLSNLYQYNTECLPQCPQGTYQVGRICALSCPSRTYYYNGLCYSTCPTPYYTYQACYSQCPSGYNCQRNIYY